MAKSLKGKLKEDESNLHHGHRQRLLELVQKNGIDNVTEVQAVEFVLTYIIPRRDTNKIAHRILNKYGNIANAMDASEFDLATIEGLNVRSAVMLKNFVDIFYLYTLGKYTGNKDILSYRDLTEFMNSMLEHRTTETICLVALNHKKQVIQHQILDNASIKNVGISPKRFSQFLLSCNPWAVAIAHNHPGGDCRPSMLDVSASKNLKEIAEKLDIDFIDSLVIGKNGVYSIRYDKLLFGGDSSFNLNTLIDELVITMKNDEKPE